MSMVANYMLCVATPTEICSRLATAVSEIFNSAQFVATEILDSPLSFSQAYCLLWQDSATGDLEGRKSCEALQAGLTAALVLDLCSHGRLLVSSQERQVLGVRWERPTAVLVDKQPTDSYLDGALLSKFLDRAKKKKGACHWPLEDLFAACFDGDAAKVVLRELVSRGVVSEVKGLCGLKKYPTVDPQPKADLTAVLHGVLLGRAEPTPYAACLLTLLHAADANLYQPRLVKPQFAPHDYPPALSALEALARRTRAEAQGAAAGDDLPLVLRDAQRAGHDDDPHEAP
eukprot:EG_transcript_17672